MEEKAAAEEKHSDKSFSLLAERIRIAQHLEADVLFNVT